MDTVHATLEENGVSEEQLKQAWEDKKGEAEEILKDEKKVNKLVELALKMCDKMSGFPTVGVVFQDTATACRMISDYVNGDYKEVPLASIIAIVAAIIYLVSPIDVIPDAIPFIGQIDDLVVLRFALEWIRSDLNAYREWKCS